MVFAHIVEEELVVTCHLVDCCVEEAEAEKETPSIRMCRSVPYVLSARHMMQYDQGADNEDFGLLL